jgi:mRNA interferase YafQ
MRDVVYLPALKKDQVRMTRRGKDVQKLNDAVVFLAENGTLPVQYDAHKLHGEYAGYWECHLESDWLLVYTLTPETVVISRTGTHADIFE